MTALLALVFCMCGCGGSGVKVKADISGYSEFPVVITGLSDEELVVTPRELAELRCVSATVTGKSDKAGTVSPVGPTIETLLEKYGYELSDVDTVRFCASDDYTVTFSQKSLSQFTFILGVANGDDALPESEQPVRLVVDGDDSGRWVRMVVRMEFKLAD